MKYLAEGIKQLPRNLLNFELNLSYNNLGNNVENMKYLGNGLKQLPSNLKGL